MEGCSIDIFETFPLHGVKEFVKSCSTLVIGSSEPSVLPPNSSGTHNSKSSIHLEKSLTILVTLMHPLLTSICLTMLKFPLVTQGPSLYSFIASISSQHSDFSLLLCGPYTLIKNHAREFVLIQTCL